MGNPSELRFVPSSCATTPIDWSKVPEASKKFFLEQWGTYYDSHTEAYTESDTEPDNESDTGSDSDFEGSMTPKTRPLPATIDDLAKMFDDSKFFGYMSSEICTFLLDISEFGLAKPRITKSFGLPVGPRFYMKYVYQVWFVLFTPGSRHAITGWSPKIPHAEDSFEATGIARDKALAEDYDAKLCEEVRRLGTAGAAATKKVAGWKASTLKSSLELAQLTEKVMELPAGHGAHVGMNQFYLESFGDLCSR